MVSSSESILAKNSTFTSDSLNNTLQGAKSKYLDSVSLTVGALQNGGSAKTIANLLGLVNRVTVSVAGTVEIVSFYYSAVTNADNTSLSATANYQASVPRRTALHYTKFTKNTSGTDDTSLNNWDHEFQGLGNVTGVLFNNTTVSGGATLIADETLTQVGIDVDGVNNVLLYEVHEMGSLTNNYTGQMNSALQDSPASLAILDNYYWLPIKEAIPRNSNIKVHAMAGVNAEAASDITIQQIPF